MDGEEGKVPPGEGQLGRPMNEGDPGEEEEKAEQVGKNLEIDIKTPTQDAKGNSGGNGGKNLQSPTFGMRNLPKGSGQLDFSSPSVSFSSPTFQNASFNNPQGFGQLPAGGNLFASSAGDFPSAFGAFPSGGSLFPGGEDQNKPGNPSIFNLGGGSTSTFAQPASSSQSVFGNSFPSILPLGPGQSDGAGNEGASNLGSGQQVFGWIPNKQDGAAEAGKEEGLKSSDTGKGTEISDLPVPEGQPQSTPTGTETSKPPASAGEQKLPAKPKEENLSSAENPLTGDDHEINFEDLAAYEARARVTAKTSNGQRSMGWGPIKFKFKEPNGLDMRIIHTPANEGPTEIELTSKTSFSRKKEKSFLIINPSGSFIVQHITKQAGDQFYMRILKVITKLKVTDAKEAPLNPTGGANSRKTQDDPKPTVSATTPAAQTKPKISKADKERDLLMKRKKLLEKKLLLKKKSNQSGASDGASADKPKVKEEPAAKEQQVQIPPSKPAKVEQPQQSEAQANLGSKKGLEPEKPLKATTGTAAPPTKPEAPTAKPVILNPNPATTLLKPNLPAQTQQASGAQAIDTATKSTKESSVQAQTSVAEGKESTSATAVVKKTFSGAPETENAGGSATGKATPKFGLDLSQYGTKSQSFTFQSAAPTLFSGAPRFTFGVAQGGAGKFNPNAKPFVPTPSTDSKSPTEPAESSTSPMEIVRTSATANLSATKPLFGETKAPAAPTGDSPLKAPPMNLGGFTTLTPAQSSSGLQPSSLFGATRTLLGKPETQAMPANTTFKTGIAGTQGKEELATKATGGQAQTKAQAVPESAQSTSKIVNLNTFSAPSSAATLAKSKATPTTGAGNSVPAGTSSGSQIIASLAAVKGKSIDSGDSAAKTANEADATKPSAPSGTAGGVTTSKAIVLNRTPPSKPAADVGQANTRAAAQKQATEAISKPVAATVVKTGPSTTVKPTAGAPTKQTTQPAMGKSTIISLVGSKPQPQTTPPATVPQEQPKAKPDTPVKTSLKRKKSDLAKKRSGKQGKGQEAKSPRLTEAMKSSSADSAKKKVKEQQPPSGTAALKDESSTQQAPDEQKVVGIGEGPTGAKRSDRQQVMALQSQLQTKNNAKVAGTAKAEQLPTSQKQVEKTVLLRSIRSGVAPAAQVASQVDPQKYVDKVIAKMEKEKHQFKRKLAGLRSTARKKLKLQAAPLSREDYDARLATFTASTWPAQFGKLSPMECAKHGWYNSDVNVLQSADTDGTITFEMLADDAATEEVRVRELVTGRGHKVMSGWIGQASPNSFEDMPVDFNTPLTVEKRQESLFALSLPLKPAKSTVEKLDYQKVKKLREEKLISEEKFNSFILALFGWSPETISLSGSFFKSVLCCTLCGTNVAVDRVEEMDAEGEHRWFCPIVRTESWRSGLEEFIKSKDKKGTANNVDMELTDESRRKEENSSGLLKDATEKHKVAGMEGNPAAITNIEVSAIGFGDKQKQSEPSVAEPTSLEEKKSDQQGKEHEDSRAVEKNTDMDTT